MCILSYYTQKEGSGGLVSRAQSNLYCILQCCVANKHISLYYTQKEGVGGLFNWALSNSYRILQYCVLQYFTIQFILYYTRKEGIGGLFNGALSNTFRGFGAACVLVLYDFLTKLIG